MFSFAHSLVYVLKDPQQSSITNRLFSGYGLMFERVSEQASAANRIISHKVASEKYKYKLVPSQRSRWREAHQERKCSVIQSIDSDEPK